MTPPGIDPGTVRLVAQRLNHYATPGHAIQLMLRQIHLQQYNEIVVHPFPDTTAMWVDMPCSLVRGSKRFRFGP